MVKRLEDIFLNYRLNYREHRRLTRSTFDTSYKFRSTKQRNEKPPFDLVLVYGDTNSTFAGALSAVSSGIKVAHIESGLRSFDRRMPEEINRILTDNLSEYHFASTETAIANLKREHVYGRSIFTGDLSVEVVNEALHISIRESKVLDRLRLIPKSYILFTMHRAENTHSTKVLTSIIEAFEILSEKYHSSNHLDHNRLVIYPIHPGTKKKFKENGLYERLENCSNLRIIDPVGYIDFIQLLQNASKTITDSGGVQKEAYILGVPCFTIRESTEWVETVKEGWNKLISVNPMGIVNSVLRRTPQMSTLKPRVDKDISEVSCKYFLEDMKPIFGTGNTSSLIKKFILSLEK
jgi:UDP-N-acetylglucosamine 2-epimerase (non-hydrolysing)